MRQENHATTMRVAIDICCGKGGATQAFRGREDWHIVGIDYEKKFEKDWQGKNLYFVHADVTQIDWRDLKETMGIPKVSFLWASPPCQKFSIAYPKFPRVGIQRAMEIVGACLEAIAILTPDRWVLENPRGRLRWFLGTPKQTIRYSDYDSKFPVEKLTDLWGNLPLPMVKHQRFINQGHTESGWMRHHHWAYAMSRNPAIRAFVPAGVSEAVYSEVQRRFLEVQQ